MTETEAELGFVFVFKVVYDTQHLALTVQIALGFMTFWAR